MELTDELKESIKEDIRKGLSPKQIYTKYHISPVQYSEIRDSMQIQEAQDHISESRPAVIKRHRRKGNVSFLGFIFLALFLLTLFYTIYKRATGPVLGFDIILALAFVISSIIFFVMEA